ncbi:hypothetical protein CPB84DRAFT_1695962, partial [Gymnopilus junonius]
VLHGIAIFMTVFRVYHRTRTRRMWWDDFMASLSMLVDTAYISVLWLAYAGSLLQTYNSLVARYWLSTMLFLLIVWMARISLALTIPRIFSPKDTTRRFAVGLALLLMTLCLVTITQSAVICSKRLASSTVPVCCVLIAYPASIFSDALLVAVPLYKLWSVRLPRKQRRLILICFTAGSLTATATISCTVFQFAPESWEPAKSVLRGKVNYLEASLLFNCFYYLDPSLCCSSSPALH